MKNNDKKKFGRNKNSEKLYQVTPPALLYAMQYLWLFCTRCFLTRLTDVHHDAPEWNSRKGHILYLLVPCGVSLQSFHRNFFFLYFNSFFFSSIVITANISNLY